MDWKTPLRNLQADFIERLKVNQLLHCKRAGNHSELTVISGDKLEELYRICTNLVERYKWAPQEQVFVNKLKSMLSEEVVRERLSDFVTPIVDDEKRELQIDFTVTSDPSVGIKVEAIQGNIDTGRWWISKEEAEKNAVIVCVWIKEEIKENKKKYDVVLAGFIPTTMSNGMNEAMSFGIDELLYGGGLKGYLESVSRKNPDYTNMAKEGFEKGDYETAIANYDEALKLNPNEAKIFLRRGIARYYQGDHQGAIKDYTEAIAINFKDPYAYYNRGMAKSEIGDQLGAIADYTKAIEINAKDAYTYYGRGKVLAEIGDDQGAIADYTEAINLNPHDAYAYYQRGKVRSQMGDKRGAIADYSEAVNIHPTEKKQEESKPLSLKKFQFETLTVNSRGQQTQRRFCDGEFFEEKLNEGVILEMVAIRGGTFLMGSPDTEAERTDKESPQHQVNVPSFFMGKYPVTQKQWRSVATLPQVNFPLKESPSEFKGDNLPVESISWYEAVEFCARLSQKTGSTYRLPSEAEWEYACRAATNLNPFYFGKTITTQLVNYDGKYIYGSAPKGKYRGQTTPVAKFPPNAFGLHDLHGNVWEWCADHWHNNYFNAPTDGSVWLADLAANESQFRVRRGGSWYNNPANCRSACRNACESSESYYYIGFRVVRNPNG
ncbi:MAG: SUMF1/EgtB/PvdO family nonheme iron enzyme [Gomphosphaeria aponina SAG 52.96 = DSM 107014]|uniref:SUMF1/EgtB/PvdO family nonheme iron enzyme n=1 Tax=Gomphosphaeria aponina SAG 52.96 = DSM 107014 TaxID=1521640 RepID=A0A941JSV2_9CHRO|nr:SUMF1/EgtB/PvdO family nonheme iron enzyme [Gomphosphaeria aponina SAG 52.96 = DSM 107014]